MEQQVYTGAVEFGGWMLDRMRKGSVRAIARGQARASLEDFVSKVNECNAKRVCTNGLKMHR